MDKGIKSDGAYKFIYELIFFVVLLTILLVSCEKLSPKEECIQQFIEAKDLVRYMKQKIEGQFTYELLETEDQFYFLVGHHLIDFVANPMDCNGKSLCQDPLSEGCFDFIPEAINHGIVAISK